MIPFKIFNRWTGEVQFEAQIDCAEDADLSIKRGAAVLWAVRHKADLSGADLSRAVLRGAVLRWADLSGADLSDAVLRDANIPAIPHIDAAILASIESNKATGANGLEMGGWHGAPCDETNWCGTTHCRAGYAICLAGAAGFALEREVGPAAAGALIYAKSRPDQPIPNFYDSNEVALADLERCAAADPLPAA